MEDCDAIEVAPAPTDGVYADLAADLAVRCPPLRVRASSPQTDTNRGFILAQVAELTGRANRWDHLQDFNWLRATPSPHWRVAAGLSVQLN